MPLTKNALKVIIELIINDARRAAQDTKYKESNINPVKLFRCHFS